MKLTEIEGNIYFFADDKNSIEITNESLKDFCLSIGQLNLNDFVEYCKNKNITQLTKEDFRLYCLAEDITPEEPIVDIGEIPEYISGEKNESLGQFLDDLCSGKTTKEAGDESATEICCMKASKQLSDNFAQMQNELEDLYEDSKTSLQNIRTITNYRVPSTYSNNDEVVALYVNLNANLTKLKRLRNQFIDIENAFAEPDTVRHDLDTDLAEELQNSLVEYINSLSVDELIEYKDTIREKQEELQQVLSDIGDDPDFSTMSPEEIKEYTEEKFKQTKFYILTQQRIQLCEEGIESTNILLGTEITKTHHSRYQAINDNLVELKETYLYQIGGFEEDLNQIIATCPGTESMDTQPTQLLDEVPLGSKFDITSEKITPEDRSYWVKYCSLLSVVSGAAVPFWSTGIVTPAGPIPLPTVYLNLGVISIKIPFPVGDTMVSLPFLIVPNLAITGTVVSPYVLFVSLAPFPIGPIRPNSIVCLYTWRSVLTTLIDSGESKELKPTTINIGSVNLDVSPELTLLLSLIIKDDLPPYSRLKLTNVPFVALTLLKIAQRQRQTTGLF